MLFATSLMLMSVCLSKEQAALILCRIIYSFGDVPVCFLNNI